MGVTGTWAHVEDVRGGAPGLGKEFIGSREELLGPPGMGGKRRQAVEAGGRGSRQGGQSFRAQARWEGGGCGCKD